MTLERERFIERLPDSKRYVLAPRVLALAGGFSSEDRLVRVARPLLFDKTRQIGWPLAIAVADGEHMRVRMTTDSATSLGLHKRHVGSEIAMAGCSSGILHLANLEDAEREAQLFLLGRSQDPLQILTRDRPSLERYLAEARRDDFSAGPDLGRERSVSVPLRADGRLRAVLVMMYIARGVSRGELLSRFVPELQALANEIEMQAFASQTSVTS